MPEYMLCRICLTEDINSEAMAPLFDDNDAQCRELVRKIEEVGSIKVHVDANVKSCDLTHSVLSAGAAAEHPQYVVLQLRGATDQCPQVPGALPGERAHICHQCSQGTYRVDGPHINIPLDPVPSQAEMKSEPTDEVPHVVADNIEYIYESANDFIDGVEDDIGMENIMEEPLEDGVGETSQAYETSTVVDDLDEDDLLVPNSTDSDYQPIERCRKAKVRKTRMTKRGRGRPRGASSGHPRSFSEERPPVQASFKSSPEVSSTNIMCEICGNIYSKRAALNIHMRRHMAEKPFKCE